MMCVNNPYQTRPQFGKLYEIGKKARSEALKIPRPEWVKEKLRKPKKSKLNYKKPKSESHRKSISEALKGKKKSSTHQKNLRASLQPFYDSRKKLKKKRKYITENYFKLLMVLEANSLKNIA